jgi:hypothetical protein
MIVDFLGSLPVLVMVLLKNRREIFGFILELTGIMSVKFVEIKVLKGLKV